jgi:hypothetical protein
MHFNGEYDILYQTMTGDVQNPVFKVRFLNYKFGAANKTNRNRLADERSIGDYNIGDIVVGQTEKGEWIEGVIKKINKIGDSEGSIIVSSINKNKRYELDPTTVRFRDEGKMFTDKVDLSDFENNKFTKM